MLGGEPTPATRPMLLLAALLLAPDAADPNAADAAPVLEQRPLFVAGRGGSHTYRIPALLVTPAGTLLAFCEGRKTSWKDHGDVDLLVARSADGGRTWSPPRVLYEEGGDAAVTIGNPCPLVDAATGVIWLPLCRDNRDVLLTRSADDGLTWEPPRELPGVVRDDWTWVATGPGVGVQLRTGPHAGRLVVPCDHRDGAPVPDDSRNRCFAHVMLSDDHGETWRLGGVTEPGAYECQVAQLADGRLTLNARMQQNSRGYRGVALSDDGGESWSAIRHHEVLPDPICQASLIRIPSTDPGEPERSRLLFSNPAVRYRPGRDKIAQRFRLTVRLSPDGGRTWPTARLLHAGPSGYSCLAALPDGSVGCLYERGEEHFRETLTFARFNLAWLAAGGGAP